MNFPETANRKLQKENELAGLGGRRAASTAAATARSASRSRRSSPRSTSRATAPPSRGWTSPSSPRPRTTRPPAPSSRASGCPSSAANPRKTTDGQESSSPKRETGTDPRGRTMRVFSRAASPVAKFRPSALPRNTRQRRSKAINGRPVCKPGTSVFLGPSSSSEPAAEATRGFVSRTSAKMTKF